jgi:hypothetical protein
LVIEDQQEVRSEISRLLDYKIVLGLLQLVVTGTALWEADREHCSGGFGQLDGAGNLT